MPLRFLCFAFVACVSSVNSQLVLSVGQRVEWVTLEGRPRDTEGRTVDGTGTGLAADPLTGRVVASTGGPDLVAVGGSRLVNAGPLTASTRVAALAVDPVGRHVYWTTGLNRTILRIAIDPPLPGASAHQPELVLRFDKEVPHGIAIDPCSGTIFWSNRALDTATVERGLLPSSGTADIDTRGLVASTDLFQPLGLAWAGGWVYWADERSGTRFRLERARPDGSARTLLVAGSNQQPFALVATPSALFWTDVQQMALWTLELERPGAEPQRLRKFSASPTGLATISMTPEELVCPRVAPVAQRLRSEIDGSIKCPAEYCLNGGVCTVNQGARSCSCPAGFSGSRCQYENRLCAAYCLDKASTIASPLYRICRCSRDNVSPLPMAVVEDSNLQIHRAIVAWRSIAFGLGGATLLAAGAAIFLAVISYRLSKRPRLRRRYTVTKTKPSGGSGSAAVSNNQCEIDIENCCNMNICETPCFEPELRKGDCNVFSRDEKRGLIDSEEPVAACIPPALAACNDF